MILRNAAVRHGRTWAPSVTRSFLRQYSLRNPDPAPQESLDAAKETMNWATKQGQASQEQKRADTTPKIRTGRRKQTKYVQDTIYSMAIDSSTKHQGRQWSEGHQIGDRQLTPKQQRQEFGRIRSKTKRLGTKVTRGYSPANLVNNPPAPEDVTLELLMASQTHMGHHTSVWNPANSRYIYGVREKTHMISLETTAAHLRRAARVVEETAFNGGIVLFVGTRNNQMEIVTRAAARAGGCHVFTKWAPGSITNRDVMLAGHESQVISDKDQKLHGFDMFVNNARPLMPDLVVCLNPMENYTLLYECGLKTIPTIGIIDTDADPTWVTYTIPANDDSLRSVGLIGGVLGRAGERGQQRRRHAAEVGQTPWRTSSELNSFISSERKTDFAKQKPVMGVTQEYQGLNEEEQKLIQSQYPKDEVVKVDEDAMLMMMGEAAGLEMEAELEAVEAAAGEIGNVSSGLGALSIEEQLDAVQARTKEVDEALKGPKA